MWEMASGKPANGWIDWRLGDAGGTDCCSRSASEVNSGCKIPARGVTETLGRAPAPALACLAEPQVNSPAPFSNWHLITAPVTAAKVTAPIKPQPCQAVAPWS